MLILSSLLVCRHRRRHQSYGRHRRHHQMMKVQSVQRLVGM